MWNAYPADVDRPNGPKPIDPADLERSRREQAERKQGTDMEALRGRELMKFDGKLTGVEAGTELGQGSKDGLPHDEVLSLIADAQAKLSAAGLSLKITPKVEGLALALRGVHADAGVY
jgi:hypothetical protein